MLKAWLKGGLLAGVIIFIWSAISWTVLPWHMMTLHSFKNEAAVAHAITANAPHSGVYMMPMQETVPYTNQPMIFASVHLEGVTPMHRAIIFQLLIQFVSAFIVTWLLMQAANLTYWRKVGFVVVFALGAAIIGNLPYWNWFSFDTAYTLVEVGDIVIGWFLAGLVLAKIVRN